MATLYGIPNCDTVQQARRWLDAHAIAYRFHDLRRDGVDPARLREWIQALGWETLLNRRGATWRGLAEAERADLDADKAARLMLRRPTLIKRPVLEAGPRLLVGFRELDYETLDDIRD